MKTRKGFTLIEMMVVMAIVGFILAMGVPIFSTMAMNRSLTGACDSMQGTIYKFREVSSSKGIPVFLVVEWWHMEDASNPLPPKLSPWTVTLNESTGKWEPVKIEQSIEFPKHVWFNENWWKNEISVMTQAVPSTIPFSSQANILLRGSDSPDEYKFDQTSKIHKGKAYVLMFLPDGNIEIIGRDNVPGFSLEEAEASADGDIWVTNGENTILIDINPNTARTNWRKIDGTK